MLGQLISFVLFVLFCMKFVWPYLTEVIRERQKTIAAGLADAAAAQEQLAQADVEADKTLDEAKKEAAGLIAQARNRASQILEESKAQATVEADRIVQSAQTEIDQEINRAREALRARVGELAVKGAEKILETAVDQSAHKAMLGKLASQL